MVKELDKPKKFTIVYYEGTPERKAWYSLYVDGKVVHQCTDNTSLIDVIFKTLGATLEYREVNREWYEDRSFGALPTTLEEVPLA